MKHKEVSMIDVVTRTENVVEDLVVPVNEVHHLFKIIGLVGSLVDVYKKAIFYKNVITVDDRAKIHNCLTYTTQAIRDFDNYLYYKNSGIHPKLIMNTRLLHAAMGLVTESAEIIENIHKSLDHPAVYTVDLDKNNLIEEFGDVGYYKTQGLDSIGSCDQEATSVCKTKLEKRYPQKFEVDLAINRNLESERQVIDKEINNDK